MQVEVDTPEVMWAKTHARHQLEHYEAKLAEAERVVSSAKLNLEAAQYNLNQAKGWLAGAKRLVELVGTE